MKYMLDTNICIYVIKKQPAKILDTFQKIAAGDLCLSSVTLSELMYGVHKSQHQQKNLAALTEFTLPLEILPYDEMAAAHYGEVRVNLEKQGTIIGPLDLMIAAHARSLNLILVTHNTKEFLRVSNLLVEDWG